MRKIHILGTGCTKCTHLANAAVVAADQLGVPYEIEKVTDFLKFADFGVMVTPALVLDGKVLVAGRVPSHEEMLGLLGAEEGSHER